MSSSDDRRNDPYGWIDQASTDIWEAARTAMEKGEAHRISDEAVAHLMTSALKLYFAKTDLEERTFRPLLGKRDEYVSATEVVSAVSELLRALRLSPMELAIWFRRRPEDAQFDGEPILPRAAEGGPDDKGGV
jgi:hypothetical protein